MHNQAAQQQNSGSLINGNIQINQIINDYDETDVTGFLFKQSGKSQNLPTYQTYGNVWKQYIQNTDIQTNTITTDRIQWAPFSRIFFVDYINGQDSPAVDQFGTVLKPFKTIAHAIQQAPQFSTIIITDSGQNIGDNFTINADNLQIAAYNQTNTTKAQTTLTGSIIIQGQNIELIGLAIDSTAYDSNTITINAPNISLKLCTILTKSTHHSIAIQSAASSAFLYSCDLQRDLVQLAAPSTVLLIEIYGPFSIIGENLEISQNSTTCTVQGTQIRGSVQHSAGSLYLNNCQISGLFNSTAVNSASNRLILIQCALFNRSTYALNYLNKSGDCAFYVDNSTIYDRTTSTMTTALNLFAPQNQLDTSRIFQNVSNSPNSFFLVNSSSYGVQFSSVATMSALLSIAWSQITAIPAGFIKDGATHGAYILNGDIQQNELNPDRIKCTQNNTLIAQTAGIGSGYSAVELTRTNCNNLINSNSVEISKIYSGDSSTYSIFCVNSSVKQWGDSSNTSKTFWDSVFASNVIDTTKIENAAGTYYFFGRFSGSSPAYFRITTTTGADSLFSAGVIDGSKITDASIEGLTKLNNPDRIYLNYTGGPDSGQYVQFSKSGSDYALFYIMGGASGLSNYDQSGKIVLYNAYSSGLYYSLDLYAKAHSTFNLYLIKFYDNTSGPNLESYISWSGAYVDISDEKAKKNIKKFEPSEQCAQCYDQLDFYTYDLKKDPENTGKMFGVIAQQCQALPFFQDCTQENQRNPSEKMIYLDKTKLLMKIIAIQKNKIKQLESKINDINQKAEQMEKLKTAQLQQSLKIQKLTERVDYYANLIEEVLQMQTPAPE